MRTQTFQLITNNNIIESNAGRPTLELKTNHELVRRDNLLNRQVDVKDINLQDIKNLTAGAEKVNQQIKELIDLKELQDVLTEIEDILEKTEREWETELERKRRERSMRHR